LLEVNGNEVSASAEVYRFFENTAGKQIRIKVGPNPDGKDARDVTVVPVDDEGNLRNRAWEEDNRRKVDELSGGKLAYVHVPDTANGGLNKFKFFFFGPTRKQSAVILRPHKYPGVQSGIT